MIKLNMKYELFFGGEVELSLPKRNSKEFEALNDLERKSLERGKPIQPKY